MEFLRRHAHYFQAQETSVIFTDHKPLTFFLDSPNVKGIYARWAGELQLLNVKLAYIEGKRNKVADALSRTVFASDDCQQSGRCTNQIQEEEKLPKLLFI